MSKYKSFEEWMHNEIHPGVAMADGKLDDDWPDHECEWLAGLSVEEWFNYADRYAVVRAIEAIDAVRASLDEKHGKVA